MWRVLKIGAGLMGFLLILMTASLWISRLSEPQPQILFLQWDWAPNGESFSLQTSNVKITRPVTPPLFHPSGPPVWTSDRQWGYFIAAESYSGPQNLYRIHAGGCCFEKLLSNVERSNFSSPTQSLPVSPNGHWLNFGIANDSAVHLLNLDDRRIVNIPPQEGFLKNYGIQFSDDSQRFLFYAVNENRTERHYQYWLDEGRIENTSKLYGGAIQPFLTTDEEWLITKGINRYFRVRRDGSDREFLLPLPSWPRLPEGYREEVVAWLPENHIVLLAVYNYEDTARTLMAFDIHSGVKLWMMDDLEYGGISSDGEWLLFSSREIIYRIHPDGTRFERVYGAAPGLSVGKVWIFDSPSDGDWLIFNEGMNIWRMRWDGGNTEPIFSYPYSATFEGWTSDHQWLLITVWGHQGYMRKYYAIRPNGRDRQELIGENDFIMVHWTRIKPKSWQPLLLSLGGGSLLFARVLYRRFNLRRKPCKFRAD